MPWVISTAHTPEGEMRVCDQPMLEEVDGFPI